MKTSFLVNLGICALTAVAAQGPASTSWAQVPHYEVDAAWPKPLPDRWVMGGLGGVCVDAQDHVLILNRQDIVEGELNAGRLAPPLIELDPAGTRLVRDRGEKAGLLGSATLLIMLIAASKRTANSSLYPSPFPSPACGGGKGAGKMPCPAGATWSEPRPEEARRINNRRSSGARGRGVYARATVRRHCWAGRSSLFPPVRSRRPGPRDRSCLRFCHVPPHRHPSHPRRRQRLRQGR